MKNDTLEASNMYSIMYYICMYTSTVSDVDFDSSAVGCTNEYAVTHV